MPYKNPNDPRKIISRRRHYLRNKAKYIANSIASKEKLRKYVRTLKDKDCADCNVRYPYYVMQFDHLRDKKYHISALVNSNNFKN